MLVIKYLRTEFNYTHRHLATLSGLNTAEISLIENGRLRPSPPQLEKLAQALEVSRPSVLLEQAQLIPAQEAALPDEVTV